MDALQIRAHSLLEEVPHAFVGDARRWVAVLRGQGRRQHRAVSWRTVANYLSYLLPVLHSWAGEADSLRQITRDHVSQAIKQRQGHPARALQTALRSLFRALKQERLIFRDPTAGITVSAVYLLPRAIPADQLRGLLDRATRPVAKVIIVLAAIHGLRPTEIARSRTADLDLSAGRLRIHRPTGTHLVYLDEVTHTIIAAWLRHRRQRWPKAVNPHLIITGHTALDDTAQIEMTTFYSMIAKLGVTPNALRRDRILDEARVTADPVHLMRVFGITDSTALKYIFAAHPERRAEMTSRGR
ncbi:hypothetical protein DMB66_18470 [Actinoplanes sp. ATCC 53533]|uniref:site-specific integrase n=1 Tax=Actinoplanes sp. ATCC 53533 TaxID=1288362 RepID=UPI000F77C533|nr:site-specific integrase [Actinoplanes sp. ATCC 53533]RSM64899.1 hypothetical protein DMB66_18470 [Actinoplanes sp. ATCC 53533]